MSEVQNYEDTMSTTIDSNANSQIISSDMTPPLSPPSPIGDDEKYATPENANPEVHSDGILEGPATKNAFDTVANSYYSIHTITEQSNADNGDGSKDLVTSSELDATNTSNEDFLPPSSSTPSPQQKVLTPEQEYRDIARKLFNEEFVSIQPEEYTQFLAASDIESSSIREYYMDLFKWNANLLKSTRTLCSKLYLKGESQEIDRILSSFTKSYIKQHPSNVFCTRSFEKIYIILYSLILLNTALHNSELNKKSKISQTDYIRNTFTTFIQQNPKSVKELTIKQRIIIERELSVYYEDLSKSELYLKTSEEPVKTSTKQKRRSIAEVIKSNATTSTTPVNHNYQEQPQQQSQPLSPQQAQQGQSDQIQSYISSVIPKTQVETAQPIVNESQNDSELAPLTRQKSEVSLWSTDTANNNGGRNSFGVKRMSSASSNVSNFSSANHGGTLHSKGSRVGFTRALASDQMNKFYNNNNGSRVSSVSSAPQSLKNRQSLDHLRGVPTRGAQNSSVNRRSSRASIVSKESISSMNNEDSISLFSLDTTQMNHLEVEGLDDEQDGDVTQQPMEDFNVEDYQDQYDLTLELQGSPYLKEGLLKLKIINNDQQDSVGDIPPPVSSAASTSSTASGRGFFSFFKIGSHNSASSSNSNNISTNTGTNSSIIPANKFVENFVVVSKGELSLYSFDPKIIKKHQQKIKKLKQKQIVQLLDSDDEDDNIGDGNWLKNAANVGNYNLCSTYAQLERSPMTTNSSGKKLIYWSLTFSKVSKKSPKKFVFEAGTKEIALEFVNTCNFWASKITAIPTSEESISSIEYGWTDLDGLIRRRDYFKKSKAIQRWESLPKGVYLSNYIVADQLDIEANHLGMMKQFVKTLRYYTNLKKLFNEFNQKKIKFIKNFKQYSNTSNYKTIVNNYENKVQEYKTDLNKYKTYLIILGFGLQLRFDLEQQDREAAILDQLESSDSINDINDPKKINEEATKLYQSQYESDSDLTLLVKFEIRKLFTSIKDVGKVIPTFQSSRSINNLIEMNKQHQQQALYYPNYYQNRSFNQEDRAFSLVKSPKTFALSHYKDNESPINQLLQTIDNCNGVHPDEKDMLHSFSTNTIKEEEEPEEHDASDDTKTTEVYSPVSYQVAPIASQ